MMDNKKESEDSEAIDNFETSKDSNKSRAIDSKPNGSKSPIEETLEEDLPKIDLSKKIITQQKKIGVNTLEYPSPEELKQQIEALLFASAKRVSAGEISRVCNVGLNEVKKALSELQQDYKEKKGSLQLIEEGDSFKLTVKEKYMPIVQNVVVETELSKTVMETLAVIAFKNPCMQSDIIKVRTNKAYEHLSELEQLGYITREPFKRTRKIRLTPKFFEYFDIPSNKLKDAFGTLHAVEKAIEEKEQENKIKKKEIKKMEKEQSKWKKARKNGTEHEMNKLGDLEIFEEKIRKEREEIEEDTAEHLGKLEVFDEPDEQKEEESNEERVEEEKSKYTDEDIDEEGTDEIIGEESLEAETTDEQTEETSPEKEEETEETYEKFVEDSNKEDSESEKTKDIEFKKTEVPLKTKSEAEIDKLADEIMSGRIVEEEKVQTNEEIGEEHYEKKEIKEEQDEEEGIDLIEAKFSKRKR